MDFLQIDEDLKVGDIIGVINATDIDRSGIDSEVDKTFLKSITASFRIYFLTKTNQNR